MSNFNIDMPFIKGQSGNYRGRPKMRHSATTSIGLLERLRKGYYTKKKVVQLLNKLSEKEQLDFLVDMLPYLESKKASKVEMSLDQLPDRDLRVIYDDVMSSISIPLFQLEKHTNGTGS